MILAATYTALCNRTVFYTYSTGRISYLWCGVWFAGRPDMPDHRNRMQDLAFLLPLHPHKKSDTDTIAVWWQFLDKNGSLEKDPHPCGWQSWHFAGVQAFLPVAA